MCANNAKVSDCQEGNIEEGQYCEVNYSKKHAIQRTRQEGEMTSVHWCVKKNDGLTQTELLNGIHSYALLKTKMWSWCGEGPEEGHEKHLL